MRSGGSGAGRALAGSSPTPRRGCAHRARVLCLGSVLGLMAPAMSGHAAAEGGPAPRHEMPNIEPGARGQRLADGSLFLPKPAQFQLGLRSRIAEAGSYRSRRRLSGQVIPDPGFHGVVAAAQNGVLELDPSFLPTPGTPVRRGQTLGWLQANISNLDQARLRSELALAVQDVKIKEQEMVVLEYRMGQQFQQASSNFTLDQLRAELKGLERRRDELTRAQSQRIPLRAPLDGQVVHARLQSGATLAAGEPVFEILDPGHLWLMVTAYEPRGSGPPPRALPADAHADRSILEFVGEGVGDRDTALRWYFRIQPAAEGPSLLVGESLKLEVEVGEPLPGVALDAEAVVRQTDGRRVIWVQEQAERFVSRAVEPQTLSRDQVLVPTAALAAGERVVTRGAWLLAQLQ